MSTSNPLPFALATPAPVTGNSNSTAVLPFNVNNTLGALLIGGLFAAAFWGVTSVQTFIYYQHSGNDRLSLKIFVALLWLLDTFDGCLTSHILYYYLVTNFFDPLAVAAPVWSLIIHISVTSVTNTLIRSMFAWRVWRISRHNIYLTGTVIVISLLDLSLALVITAKGFRITSFAEMDAISVYLYIDFAAIFSGDLLVAVILCYYLFKSRTGLRNTDTLVNTLVSYAITTGLLTSIDVMLGSIFYIFMPQNFIFIGFYLNLAKLYTNSYLALLNARDRLRDRSDEPVSIHLSRLSDRRYGTVSSRTQDLQSMSADIESKEPSQDPALHRQTLGLGPALHCSTLSQAKSIDIISCLFVLSILLFSGCTEAIKECAP